MSHRAVELKSSPCGHVERTIQGQPAFVPDPVPREVGLSSETVFLLDKATRAVGTLAGVAETLPNPHLLIRPFVRREAVLSSKIEGTQASISDLFMFEASKERVERGDVREVTNYVHALELGIALLDELPLSTRLVNQVHERLLTGVRGEDKMPGKLRPWPVWIGNAGTPIEESRYIPPPAERVQDLLADWERFVNSDLQMPPLVQCALMHYQFEAIHPYMDGNGRIGRLLIVLFLCAKDILPKPLLYLSAYFDKNRDDYYDELFRVSLTGEFEPWLQFFLKGTHEQAWDALVRSRRVRDLLEQYKEALQQKKASANALRLLDHLFVNPFVTVPVAQDVLQVTYAGARGVLQRLEDAGILSPVADTWPKMFIARDILHAIEAPVAGR
jgi:Fic family protein